MQFQRASKKRAKLRLALSGVSGGGKTWSSLAIATGLVPEGRVALIDTERGSASLYGNRFAFDVLELERFAPTDYVQALEVAQAGKYDVIVIDSLSHAWAGAGGALEQVDQVIERGGGNSFTAWRKVTPMHTRLVDAMLACNAHLIVTVRSKTEYAMEPDDKGKMSVKKLGLAPVQRAGLEYEFSMFGDLNLDHHLIISKSRADVVAVGEIIDKPDARFAKRLRDWLDDGGEPASAVRPEVKAFVELMGKPDTPAESPLDATFAAYLSAMTDAPDIATLERAATAPAKPPKGSPEHVRAAAVYLARRTQLNGASPK